MIKVVFQNRGYWLTVTFEEQVEESGVAAHRLKIEAGKLSTMELSPGDFSRHLPARLAGWVISVEKSFTVFCEALPQKERAKAIRIYDRAVRKAVARVMPEFRARTGAQGKVRIACESTCISAFHAEAYDGSPQFHHHVAFESRVRVPGKTKTYAFNARELYAKKELLQTLVAHEVAYAIQRAFGVRLERSGGSYRLADVPKALCQAASTRTRRIDEYILHHKLPNTPLVRKYVTFVTRREITNKILGRESFQNLLRESQFKSRSICNSFALSREKVDERSPLRRVTTVAQSLALRQSSFAREDLIAHALVHFGPAKSAAWVIGKVERLLREPQRFRVSVMDAGITGTTRYTTKQSIRSWDKVISRFEATIPRKSSAQDNQSVRNESLQRPTELSRTNEAAPPRTRSREYSGTDGGSRSTAGSKHSERNGPTSEQGSSDSQKEHAEQKSKYGQTAERFLRYKSVILALGNAGLDFANKAVELYETWRKPIWRAHGEGHRDTPGSVSAMARDLKKQSRLESHRQAFRAMAKLHGRSLLDRLNYGEHVYRRCRQPKLRVPKKSLVVISDVGAANPKDVELILRRAARAKAKVILVERDLRRADLVQFARTMRPGQAQRYHPPAQSQ